MSENERRRPLGQGTASATRNSRHEVTTASVIQVGDGYRWSRAERIDSAGTEGSVDVYVCRADRATVLLQVWERNRAEEQVTETAIRLGRDDACRLAALLRAAVR